jgi:hypothetical protein
VKSLRTLNRMRQWMERRNCYAYWQHKADFVCEKMYIFQCEEKRGREERSKWEKKKPTSSTLHEDERAIVYVGRFHSQFISSAQKCSLCSGLFKHDTSFHCNITTSPSLISLVPLFASKKCTNFYSRIFLSHSQYTKVLMSSSWRLFDVEHNFVIQIMARRWENFRFSHFIVWAQTNEFFNCSRRLVAKQQ